MLLQEIQRMIIQANINLLTIIIIGDLIMYIANENQRENDKFRLIYLHYESINIS